MYFIGEMNNGPFFSSDKGLRLHTVTFQYSLSTALARHIWVHWWIDRAVVTIWILSSSAQLAALVCVLAWTEFMWSRWLIKLRIDDLYGFIDLHMPGPFSQWNISQNTVYAMLDIYIKYLLYLFTYRLCIRRKEVLINGTGIFSCLCVLCVVCFYLR